MFSDKLLNKKVYLVPTYRSTFTSADDCGLIRVNSLQSITY